MGGYSTQFGSQLLGLLGAPVTNANLSALSAWAGAEGGSATNNPFNTTQPASGTTDYNSAGVRNYASYQQGLDATYQTLTNGSYGPIISSLRDGTNPGAVASAVGASPWGTSGTLMAKLLGQPLSNVPPTSGSAGSSAQPTGFSWTNPLGSVTSGLKNVMVPLMFAAAGAGLVVIGITKAASPSVRSAKGAAGQVVQQVPKAAEAAAAV